MELPGCNLCGPIAPLRTYAETAKHMYSMMHIFNQFYREQSGNQAMEALTLDAWQVFKLNQLFLKEHSFTDSTDCTTCDKRIQKSNLSNHLVGPRHRQILLARIKAIISKSSVVTAPEIKCVCLEGVAEKELWDHLCDRKHLQIESDEFFSWVHEFCSTEYKNYSGLGLDSASSSSFGSKTSPRETTNVGANDTGNPNYNFQPSSSKNQPPLFDHNSNPGTESESANSLISDNTYDNRQQRMNEDVVNQQVKQNFVRKGYVLEPEDFQCLKIENDHLNRKILRCRVCGSETTGEKPFVQHVRSEGHRKKVAINGIPKTPAAAQSSENPASKISAHLNTPPTQVAPNGDFSGDETISRIIGRLFPTESPTQGIKGVQSVSGETGYDLSGFSRTPSIVSEVQSKYSDSTTGRGDFNMSNESGVCFACLSAQKRSTFPSQKQLSIHVRTEHLQEMQAVRRKIQRNPDCAECFVCRDCRYKEAAAFNEHLASNEHLKRVKEQYKVPYTCIVCHITLPQEIVYILHLRSPEHLELVHSFPALNRNPGMRAEADEGESESSGGSGSTDALSESVNLNYNNCALCRVTFTDIRMAKQHYAGKKHAKKAMSQSGASDASSISSGSSTSGCDDSAIVKCCEDIGDFSTEHRDQIMRDYYETKAIVSSVPRYYQHDIYRRIMLENYSFYCYLPTGLGKTLIACLVMSKMLDLNPALNNHPRIFFVTDKILLTMQQKNYIKSQFEASNSRHIKVGAVCGNQIQCEPNVDIKNHDILLFTAEFLRQRLQVGFFNWSKVCCVIFDEVHHCDQNHPYRALINQFHLPLVSANKPHPKLIGLTASPAIDKAGERRTLECLRDRLKIFGQAKLVTANLEEIEKHRVIPNVQFKQQNMDQDYREFAAAVARIVDSYIAERMQFFNRLPGKIQDLCSDQRRVTTDTSWIFSVDSECQNLMEEIEDSLDPLVIQVIRILIDLLEVLFLANFVNMYEAYIVLSGIPSRLSSGRTMDQLQSAIQEFHTKAENDRNASDSPFEKLKAEIQDTFRHSRGESHKKFMLVLVTSRCHALSLARVLKTDPTVIGFNLQVGCVVGHGSRAFLKGMSVEKQKQALADMKHKNIFVATSVAEEGIDVPSCEKVVLLNAPKDTTAFVQIRGRARKENSTVVLIGGIEEQVKLNSLINNEKFMLEAVQKLNNVIIN